MENGVSTTFKTAGKSGLIGGKEEVDAADASGRASGRGCWAE